MNDTLVPSSQTNHIQELAALFLESRKDTDFAKLYKRLQPGITNYVWTILRTSPRGSKELLQDIVAQTFAKIYTKVDQYDIYYKFSTWAYSIARNETLTELKRNVGFVSIDKLNSSVTSGGVHGEGKLAGFFQKQALDPEAQMTSIDIDSIDNKEMTTEELYDLVIQEMQNLDPMYKHILIDRELHGLKYEELADKYELPLNTLKSRIRLGRERLRSNIEKIKKEDAYEV